MKKQSILKKILLLFVIIGLYNCQQEPVSKTDTNPAKDKEEIKQVLINMWDAIEKEDMELYASYVHPDFTQFGEYDSILKIGKEAEVNGIKQWVEDASNIHTEMVDPIVTVKGNVAWIVYYWQDHGITDEGEFSSRGKSTRIFVKEAGNWLCIHGHYTLLP